MPQCLYRIRRAFLIPLGLDVMLLLTLLLMALLLNGDTAERLVFVLFFFPAGYLFLECLRRQVIVAEGGLVIRKLWSEKAISWDEITHVGGLTVHKKVYLLLTTVKGFFIVSSAFEGFSALAGEIAARVGFERVEEEVRLQADRSVTGIAPVVSAWIAAAVLIGIILLKVSPFIV
ncbi:MAG: DUF6585 family protein [Syntrophales bacterium]